MNCTPPGPGSLSINKTVTGGPAGYVGPFDIQYSCTNGGPSGTASVTADVPFVINNIPNGSVCTVSENTLPPAPAGFLWSSQSDTGGTVTISTGKTASVAVTNGLSPIPVAPAVIVPAPAKKPGVRPGPEACQGDGRRGRGGGAGQGHHPDVGAGRWWV